MKYLLQMIVIPFCALTLSSCAGEKENIEMFFHFESKKTVINQRTSLKLKSIIQRLESERNIMVDKMPGLKYGYFSEGGVLYGWQGGVLFREENGITYIVRDVFLADLAEKWVVNTPEDWEKVLVWLHRNDLID